MKHPLFIPLIHLRTEDVQACLLTTNMENIKSPFVAFRQGKETIIEEFETIASLAKKLEELLKDRPKNKLWDKEDWANTLGK